MHVKISNTYSFTGLKTNKHTKTKTQQAPSQHSKRNFVFAYVSTHSQTRALPTDTNNLPMFLAEMKVCSKMHYKIYVE